MSTEKSLLERVAKEVGKLATLLNGDPYNPQDTGMKGMLLGAVEDLKSFNATDHKANTAFRERKESEMSRITVGVIILIANVVVTSVIAIAIKTAAQ